MSRRALDRCHWACSVAAPRLTGAQRSVLHVIASHADADGRNAFVSQEKMSRSAGVGAERGAEYDTAPVRKILKRLEALGLIEGERRSGKTTIWSLNLAWTPVPQDRGTPVAEDLGTERRRAVDPGPTPVQPRSSGTYEGEGEGQHPLSPPSEVKGREEGELVDFDPNNLVELKRWVA
jgi:hypothetical protein